MDSGPRLFLVNFDSITHIYFNSSQHAMFTSCISFTTLLKICEWASKQSPDPRILPHRDHAPGFEIPGSATVLDLKATDFDHVNSKNA